MSRVIVILIDGNIINLQGDLFATEQDHIYVWNGDKPVGMFKTESVVACYITVQRKELQDE